VLTATVLVALGCNDRDSGRMPTDPALDAGSAQASSDRDGGRGNDGSGSRFKMFGNARMTRDPENRSNVVLEFRAPVSGAIRDLRVKIWQLDHQINVKWAFVARSCGGGSPRISLFVDANGDGKFQQAPAGPDFVAHGHFNPPLFAACETSAPTGASDGPSMSTLRWRFEDFTDELVRWEITPATAIPGRPVGPIGGAGAVNWDGLEQIIAMALPNHRVIRGMLVDDAGPPNGIAYFDLLTIFDLTLGTRGQTTPERGNNDKDSDSEN
jgi:hypothetical protein